MAHIFGARTCTQRTWKTGAGVRPKTSPRVQGCLEGRKLCKLKSGISVARTRSNSLCPLLSLTLPHFSLLLQLLSLFAVPSNASSFVCVCLLSVLTNVLLAPTRRRRRFFKSFRLQKLCGNGSDKRKTTIEWGCVPGMRVYMCVCVDTCPSYPAKR